MLPSSRRQRDESHNDQVSNFNGWNSSHELNSHPRHGYERRPLSSTSNSITEQQQRQVITIQVPSLIADGIEATRDLCSSCCQAAWELTTARLFPSKIVLYRISVMAIAWERVLEDLCWEATQNNESCLSAFSTSSATTATIPPPPLVVMSTGPETKFGLPWNDNNRINDDMAMQYVSWLLPLALLIIFITQHQWVSTTALLWPHASSRRHHRHDQAEEAFLAAALVSLLCLEALFPLTILGCTSLFLLHKISCTTSLFVLGGVYAISSSTAGWIRCILYSYIGGIE